MSAKATVFVSLKVEDLGEVMNHRHSAECADVPVSQIGPVITTLVASETEQKVVLDTLGVVRGFMIRAIDYDLLVDLTYDDVEFNETLLLSAGEEATYIPNPQGDIYVINAEDGETPTFEYSAWGIASE